MQQTTPSPFTGAQHASDRDGAARDRSPTGFCSPPSSGIGGSGTRFEFPICKLLDFTDAELGLDPNPVNLVILAERVTRRHPDDPVARREEKLRLFLRMAVVLTSKGYGEEQQQVLTRVLDWSIPLPEDEERIFLEQLRQQERDSPMTYLTTFERHARREGLEQGLDQGRQEGWVEALKASASVRFPEWEPSWDRILEAVEDPDLVRVWHRLLLTAPSGEEFLKSIGKQPR